MADQPFLDQTETARQGTDDNDREEEDQENETPPQVFVRPREEIQANDNDEDSNNADDDDNDDADLMNNEATEPVGLPPSPRDMIFNGIHYVIKDPRYDQNGSPNEITYNGVKYVVKDHTEGPQENDEFQRFAMLNNNAEDNEADDDEVPFPQQQDLIQFPTAQPPLDGFLTTLPQPEGAQTSDDNKKNNIADVVRAILPEVVKTVKEETTHNNNNENKRDFIPTLPPQTTTTTSRPPMTPSQSSQVTSASAISLILNGLKALGIGKQQNQKGTKREDTSQAIAITTTTTTRPHTTPKPPLPPPPHPRPTSTAPPIHLSPPVPYTVRLHYPPQLRILCFGDSLTAGYNKHGKNFYPYCSPLGNILRYQSGLNIYTEAKGIVGEMAHKQMTHRLPMVLGNATMQYDWIMILGGTNDILHVKNFGDDDEFLNQLETIWQPRITKDIEKLHDIAYKYGAHTMLLTVPENSIEAWPEYHPLLKMREKINEALRDFAYGSKGKTVLCDLAKLVPRRSLSPTMESILWDDHLHMTPQGYTKMAQAVSDCLKPYLPVRNG